MSAGSAGGTGRDDHRPTGAEAARLDRERFVTLGKGLQVSGAIFGALLLFLGGGIWLDRRLDTEPLFLLIGLVLTFLSVGYEFYDTARFFNARAAKAKAAAGASGRTVRRKSWDEWDAEERERDEDDDYATKPRRQRER